MSLTNLDSFLVELEMDLAVLINAIKASSSSLVVNRIYFKELNLLLQKDMEVRVSMLNNIYIILFIKNKIILSLLLIYILFIFRLTQCIYNK
jgi:hypothetical protein